jgi:hypothetical protein
MLVITLSDCMPSFLQFRSNLAALQEILAEANQRLTEPLVVGK